MRNIDLEKLGNACREWRTEQGKPQTSVAIETGYSQENISAFERGINDNLKIFLWYLIHWLTLDILKEKGVFDCAELQRKNDETTTQY